jgi:hypothetical protein
MAEDRGQRTDDGGRETEGRWQKLENGIQQIKSTPLNEKLENIRLMHLLSLISVFFSLSSVLCRP